MSRHQGIAVVLLAGLFGLAGGTAADAQRSQQRSAEPTPLLRLQPNALGNSLDLVESDHGSGAERRQAVTDIAVRLLPRPEMPLSVALGLENGDKRAGGRSIFDLELLVVAGGRLWPEERAECRAWVGDVAVCHAECDGGSIALIRTRGARRAYRLLVGGLPDFERDGFTSGVRLGSCADGGSGERSLQPRRGLRQAELEMVGR